MKNDMKLMTAFTTMALLHGCGSGDDFGETTVSNEAPARQESSYSPCGTYNGQPVVCQPLRPDFPFEDYGARNVPVAIE